MFLCFSLTPVVWGSVPPLLLVFIVKVKKLVNIPCSHGEPSGIQVLPRKYELSYQVFGIFMFLFRSIKKSMIAERARVTGKYVEK
jgi:hypothetical protein